MMYSVPYMIYGVQYTMHSVQYTMYYVHNARCIVHIYYDIHCLIHIIRHEFVYIDDLKYVYRLSAIRTSHIVQIPCKVLITVCIVCAISPVRLNNSYSLPTEPEPRSNKLRDVRTRAHATRSRSSDFPAVPHFA